MNTEELCNFFDNPRNNFEADKKTVKVVDKGKMKDKLMLRIFKLNAGLCGQIYVGDCNNIKDIDEILKTNGLKRIDKQQYVSTI